MTTHADLEPALGAAAPAARSTIERVLAGDDLSVAGAEQLLALRGDDLEALRLAADHLRREQAGEAVTYVVNRNVNFTNVCVKSCDFCAFSRTSRSDEGYFLPNEEIVRRAVEARDLGASEVCLQAGLAPGVDGAAYAALLRDLRRAAPELHLHAYSPEEVKYGARLSGRTLREFLLELQDAGIGSLPGTSAEVLVESVRRRISPGRITVEEWVSVITTAHELGIPTTSTLMFAHVETLAERAQHLGLLRDVQRRTHGFTEFVPLAFIRDEAPLFAEREALGLAEGHDRDDVTALYATARLFLGRDLRNLQVSWVKHGLEESQRLLACGANDLGGTLMNESISTAAGAAYGQLVKPATLRALARAAGRPPVERDTRYRTRRAFGVEPSADEAHPLDAITDADARFGTYHALAQGSEHRFRVRRKSERGLPVLTPDRPNH